MRLGRAVLAVELLEQGCFLEPERPRECADVPAGVERPTAGGEVVVLDPADDGWADVGPAAQILDRQALVGARFGQAGADTVGALDDRHPSPFGAPDSQPRRIPSLGAN